jgi:preprotein translocase YajC subunit
MFAVLLWAQDEKKAPLLPPGMELPLLMGAMFFLFYFVVLRPMKRREAREKEALFTGLKKNDKVLMKSGILGTVVSVNDKENEIVIKVDDNVRLRMVLGSVERNLSNEEAAKAAKEAKKEGAPA